VESLAGNGPEQKELFGEPRKSLGAGSA